MSKFHDLGERLLKEVPSAAQAALLGFAARHAVRAATGGYVTRTQFEEVKDSRDRFAELASKDDLTGLANRRAFGERFDHVTGLVQRYGIDAAVIALDLDRFKSINDEHGHAMGDFVLKTVAGTLLSHTRSADEVARLGGEELAVILPYATELQAAELAERIRAELADNQYLATAVGRPVTASFGVTSMSLGHMPNDYDSVMNRADTALYVAKSGSAHPLGLDRNQVVMHSAMQPRH